MKRAGGKSFTYRLLGTMAALMALIAGPAFAQGQLDTFAPLTIPGLSSDRPEDLLKLAGEYRITADGREGVLSIQATLQPTWHVYSTTQKAGGPLPSRIKVAASDQFELTRPFVADQSPHIRPADVFPVPSEEFAGAVTWTAPFRVTGSVDPKELSFAVTFNGQICQESGSCIPISNVSVPVKFAGEVPAVKRGSYVNPRIHATIRGSIEPRSVRPGETVKLVLTAEPAADYHVYALAEKDPLKVSKPALIAWKQKPSWAASKPVASEKPAQHAGPPQDPVQYWHANPVSWTVEFKVPADAAPGGYELRGLLGYQTCTNVNCDPPGGVEFNAVVAVVDTEQQVDPSPEALTFKPTTYTAAAKLAADAAARGNDPEVAAASAPSTAASKSQPPVEPLNYGGPLLQIEQMQAVGAVARERSILVVLPAALLAGFILNFMPCVLPVIGLKIVSFVQQAGHSRSRVFWLNAWYSLGLLSVFVVLASLAVFAGLGWGEQFQKPAFNIVLAAIVFAFALSFLGVWEIPLPGFVGTSGANKAAEQEGPAGAFMKGVLTTVLATPCSGPLLVPAMTWALKQPPALTYLVFICVGLGMAAPYLLVGAVPRLIRLLPKPGEWMETFKQLMGFVLLGTVVYLLTIVPQLLVIPTVAFLVGLWAALWWIGRVPVWEDLQKRLRAWAVGGAMATAIGMFAFLWMARENSETELAWKPYSPEFLSKTLLADRKPVLVDFTADWCPNCKLNESVALNVARTKKFIEDNGIETIKVDMTNETPEGEKLLRQLVGTTAIPVYAIFNPEDPYRPLVMEGILTPPKIITALEQAMVSDASNRSQLSMTSAESTSTTSRVVMSEK